MVIFVDAKNFKCHTVNDGNVTAVETDFFDGKRDTFVEGYRSTIDNNVWAPSAYPAGWEVVA